MTLQAINILIYLAITILDYTQIGMEVNVDKTSFWSHDFKVFQFSFRSESLENRLFFISDDWITLVYQPDRVVKLKNVHLNHLLKKGRYNPHWITPSRRDEQVKRDQEILQR